MSLLETSAYGGLMKMMSFGIDEAPCCVELAPFKAPSLAEGVWGWVFLALFEFCKIFEFSFEFIFSSLQF